MTKGPRVSFWIKFWFGFGQGAEGIKSTALTSVLFFYYSQVLGLNPALTGFALLLAVVTDGIGDAIIGSWSDGFRHKWGRRHPFMYASIVPYGLSFAALFAPPAGLSDSGLFVWLLVWAILARNFMTLFVVPHYALGAELSHDHDERTTIVAYRAFFGYVGTALVFLAAVYFFAPTPDYANGQLNPEPYPYYGFALCLVMLVMITGSTVGTHSAIPSLPKPHPDTPPFSVSRLWRDTTGVFKNRPFQYFLAGFFVWVVGLVIFRSLDLYLGTYFWRLRTDQVLIMPVLGTLAMLPGTFFWAWTARRIGKKASFIAGVLGYCAVTMALILLLYLGFMPPQSSSLYVPIIYAGTFLASFIGTSPPVVAGSMLADIADDHDLASGRRHEGIFFGAINFATKISAGIGAQISGLLIALVGLRPKADPATVGLDTSLSLGLAAAALVTLFGVVATLIYRGYPISRERHAEIRLALAARVSDQRP